MLADEDGNIKAIIDWEFAGIGVRAFLLLTCGVAETHLGIICKTIIYNPQLRRLPQMFT
jgi:hypothetical protein